RGPQRVDAIEQLLERRRRVAVRLALEADVRVADLHEAEAAGRGVRRFGRWQGARRQHAAGRSPDERRTGPGHAREKPSTIESIHVSLLVVVGSARTGRGSRRLPVAHHFTITRARIWGWSAQKYSYAPGRVNVCANVSSLPSPADVNAPVVDVIVCVSSSWLVHRTVVPGDTCSAAGANLNSLIPTSAE